METMINLNDLLKHEIMDLYSAEEQIIEAMPAMIEKAKNPELKKALREHLKITEEQKTRLDKVKQTFGEDGEDANGEEKKGFFSRLFGSSGGEKGKGMEGLITEGEKIMKADITEEALDAAIIASAQKIEHYEISGYGTARAFARQLNLTDVEILLEQTLNEEYTADDLLTRLAVGKLNTEAEMADGSVSSPGDSGRNNGASSITANKSKSSRSGSSSKSISKLSGRSKSVTSKNDFSKSAGKSSGGRGASSKSSSSKGGSRSSGEKRNSSKGASKSSGKGASKISASKGAGKSSGSSGKRSSKSKSSKGRGR